MDKIDNTEVAKVFDSYPVEIRRKMLQLRRLIFDAAAETAYVDTVEEDLKWGEPAYITSRGSAVRLGWKASDADRYAMHFHCKTKLVDTFKGLYADKFEFEGNRAIVFDVDSKIPADELKHCISLSLVYHDVKHLPLLGA